MEKKIRYKTGIIGSGSWGISLGLALNRSGNKVKIFFNSKENYKKVLKSRISEKIPNVKIPIEIDLSNNINEVKYLDQVFMVTPSQKIRENLILLKSKKIIPKTFIICSKGIESNTGKLMSEVVSEIFKKSEIFILSGPNFAIEVAKNLPTAFVLSGKNEQTLKKLGRQISNKNFRPYFNNDLVGTQIGGSAKNIIAIACGIIKGRRLGENAKASLLTRGLSEIISLGKKMGAEKKTFFGLSGLGDLTLTCNSLKSRNLNLGYMLGQGMKLDDILSKGYLTEGMNCCNAIFELGERYNIEMPVCKAVKKVIEGCSVSEIIYNLLSRPLQFED